VPVVTRMNKVKFKAMLGPGDVVDMEVFLDTVVSDVFFMKGHILHNGKKIVQMEFASKLASLSELDLTREHRRV
jgi:3-hydroxymyristoyl/3-hydroxydecanoyl-(acyl carrier protein) dehydratase